MFGINTVNYGLTKIGLSDVCACLKTAFSSDKAMKWIKRDRFFQIIGDGYNIEYYKWNYKKQFFI
jgi:hypothetical protein